MDPPETRNPGDGENEPIITLDEDEEDGIIWNILDQQKLNVLNVK